MGLLDLSSGYRYMIGKLREQDIPLNDIRRIDLNKGRYTTIKLYGFYYLVLFKRDFYQSYEEGYGESVNVQHFHEMELRFKDNFRGCIFIYENKSIYYITTELINLYSKIETRKEGVVTYSFSIKHLKNIEGFGRYLKLIRTPSFPMENQSQESNAKAT